jgi:hypothetical protein
MFSGNTARHLHDHVISLFADQTYLYDRSNTIVLLVQIDVLLLFLHLSAVIVLFYVHLSKQEQKTVTENIFSQEK